MATKKIKGSVKMCAFACRQRDRARYFSYVLAVNPNFGPPYAPDEGGGRGGRAGGGGGRRVGASSAVSLIACPQPRPR
jgi:hypothetical protein